MLDYQSKERTEVKTPMPNGPKRAKIEMRIAERHYNFVTKIVELVDCTINEVFVLVFKSLGNNKPDKVFGMPSAFSLEEKAGKKNLPPTIAAVFQGPLRPKKQAWFFFLELIAGQEKRTKKETLEKKN